MTTHRYHPDENDPKDAVLFDNCARCVEHALNITSLDYGNIGALCDPARIPVTDTEYDALRRINNAVVIANYVNHALRRDRDYLVPGSNFNE